MTRPQCRDITKGCGSVRVNASRRDGICVSVNKNERRGVSQDGPRNQERGRYPRVWQAVFVNLTGIVLTTRYPGVISSVVYFF